MKRSTDGMQVPSEGFSAFLRLGGKTHFFLSCPKPWMISMLRSTVALLVLTAAAAAQSPRVRPVDLVNPFVGTSGHGHTFPGATVPFGMVQLSPDTRVKGWDACGGYHWSDSTIMGFSHTHLSGTGVGDYGD